MMEGREEGEQGDKEEGREVDVGKREEGEEWEQGSNVHVPALRMGKRYSQKYRAEKKKCSRSARRK